MTTDATEPRVVAGTMSQTIDGKRPGPTLEERAMVHMREQAQAELASAERLRSVSYICLSVAVVALAYLLAGIR